MCPGTSGILLHFSRSLHPLSWGSLRFPASIYWRCLGGVRTPLPLPRKAALVVAGSIVKDITAATIATLIKSVAKAR